jgi:hypothetical protein
MLYSTNKVILSKITLAGVEWNTRNAGEMLVKHLFKL